MYGKCECIYRIANERMSVCLERDPGHERNVIGHLERMPEPH